MDVLIYNIDSRTRNTTAFPDSHEFTYNKVDATIDGIVRVEPFNIKNVIEINVSNIEIPNNFHFINTTRGNNTFKCDSSDPPTTVRTINNGSYTKDEFMTELTSKLTGLNFTYSSTTGFVTITNNTGGDLNILFESTSNDNLSLGELLGFTVNSSTAIANSATLTGTKSLTIPQEPYVFLKLNDMGNILNLDKRYAAKLVPDNSSRFDDLNRETIYKTLSSLIKFDQPLDIKELKVSLVDNYSNLISINNANFSFNLEVKTISNSLLKQYEEMKFYNNEVMERILHARMLEYYDNLTKKGNTLTNQYSNNIQNQHNNIEYTPQGNRNNYNYSDDPFRK